MTDQETIKTQADIPPFVTSDIGLASFLKTSGYQLLGLQPANEDGNRVEFLFGLTEDQGQEFARNYLNRNASVDALTFTEEMGLLKRLIYRFQSRRNGNGM